MVDLKLSVDRQAHSRLVSGFRGNERNIFADTTIVKTQRPLQRRISTMNVSLVRLAFLPFFPQLLIDGYVFYFKFPLKVLAENLSHMRAANRIKEAVGLSPFQSEW